MNQLAQQIKEGNVKAYEVFFKAEFDNLCFFVAHYVRDKHLAKDIAQSALLTLWEQRWLIDEERNIRAFVFTVARNKTINVLKSQYQQANKKRAVEIDTEIEALTNAHITERIDALSLEDLIEKTYARLSKTICCSFELSRKEGLSNREIARELGISIRAVEYHIKSALRLFAESLKDYLPLCFFAIGAAYCII